MRKFLYGAILGSGAMYLFNSNYNKLGPSQSLDHEEFKLVNSYIHHHNIDKMLKQSVMNGYMQLSKAFLDYGMRVRLDGFKFYDSYFNSE